jgi:REP element-mobilizing transposase RayT
MTTPREILPGATYMLTRRTAQRMFLLKPGEVTNQVFAYCLAVAAKRCNIGVIAWLAMSNHYHAIVHDPDGRLPEFMAYFHKLVAKALNVHLERWENFWSSEEACVTRLLGVEDVFDKVVYTLANPVVADLVEHVAHWPGHSSLDHLDGKPKSYDRPGVFFSDDGVMPAKETLRAIRPPMLPSSESYASWVERVKTALKEREITARAERRRKNKTVLGKAGVLAQHPESKPAKAAIHRKLRPRLACKDQARLSLEKGKLKEFRIAHEIARVAFSKGDREVKFPGGTYKLRDLGVCCARRATVYYR